MVSIHPQRGETDAGTRADAPDRTVKVWDRESGNCVQTLVGHRGSVTSLQLSDDMIVSGSGEPRPWTDRAGIELMVQTMAT
jgi:F-box/WD-40 domain protein MET30